ncbi:putative 3-deoxy-d-manno-octulosonic-acid transferase protein [Sulfitobacter noctilucicola]|uniref:3-deoxy-D-manno-octulosonic acid transferase n=1 Tax=Sulfitobacter noctilucicola TaxID=1342301 RepID=A0A7W6Q460_9RHOB|nr:glycosyltransferase N-terminal domain-containing protein [Sulfitobacter noctilucicola]KIN63113.1 putative 3-deoxy-d-manno-octulosonic-acid transferase protein [Sulfitobacter noctilucicola]MBB4172360.1 3-deoxy-D-manno-octulosonic-acid transferase [Sulfitobacter noctilucicola]
MAGSFGLATYRALVRRQEVPQAQDGVPPRPPGELVWIHAGEPRNLLAIQDLANRLTHARPGLSVLITEADKRPVVTPTNPDTHQITVPNEHPASVDAFLDHWEPDVCIWAWGGLRPNLVIETAERRCPMFLIDADAEGFDKVRSGWRPDLTRLVLSHFDVVLARSPSAARKLQHLGLGADDVEITPALVPGGQVLPVNDHDLTDLSAAMGGRPAWFATQITPKETDIVLAAHMQALRLSHRLLLIVQPRDAEAADHVAKRANDLNMPVVRWDHDQFPDDLSQVMVSENASDRGLFFRVAPVSFLGGTLVAGTGGCDPLEAAALGSAILYGPRVRHHMPSYSRLAASGAARIVNDADALGTAVSRLIAPDQAATMAHAGWDLVSEGAALTDKVMDLVQDALDMGARR